MVSFKTNNCSSEHSPAHCHHLGTLCSPLRHCSNSYPLSQGHSHDRTLPSRCTPPRTTYPLSHGCALHSRLDQPVTSSTSAMDDKKVVQAAPAANSGQQARVKNSLDGSGVVASISGARRRSGPQGLRSPAAKRPLSAPVALQGWLHKQGSEGLMLWKKRWFVLSEYCLFYYKGPEEEKLLGSILLPSYRITVCKPEDKVNKKFAFKAEHANMRTYHFAADTRESMNQWVNALTLASLLQDPNPIKFCRSREEPPVALEIAGPADEVGSARPSVSSISSILNQSADDSDSGFHGLQSRDDPSQSNNNSSPNSINTASFPNLSASNSNHGIANSINNNNNHHSPEKIEDNQPRPMVNGWMQPPPQFNQPSTSSQQYGHMMPNSAQLQLQQQAQMHPQHQALMHQRMVRQQHQNAMQHQHQHMVQQQQQMQQQSASNVQTVQPMPRNFGQHVYANAPPKPRRLTDGSTEYSTPSPDPDFRKSPVQPNVRMSTKSPIPDYERVNSLYASRLATQSTPPIRTDKSGLNYGYSQSQPSERRTPDAYGRSAKPRNSRGNGDYEDIYSGPQLYQRPPGPVGYSKGSAPIPISVPMYVQQHQSNQIFTSIASNPPVMRQQRVQPPPRPHSADFLEYEATRKPSPQPVNQNGGIPSQQRRPQRPKSSLDVVGPSEITSNGDGYYYSEERYAAQMRQSAVYLHQNPQHHQQQRNQSLSRATTPSKSSSRVEDHNESITLNEISCSAARRSPRESQIYRQHPVATQSLQRYPETNDAMVRRSLRERNYDPSFHDSLIHGEGGTVPRRIQRDYESSPLVNGRLVDPLESHMSQSYHSGHSGSRRWNDQQFSRSASARLPRTRHPNASDATENDYERGLGQPSRDGERRIQQREESMKRLLEWKQRMLQSPLTRKPSGSANGNTRAQSELSSYYKRQVLLDLAAHEASVEARHSRRREDSHRPHVRSKSSDGRRSVANVSRYNSYSSDDEASGSGSIIGRDPLPPRAVSTSQLAAQNPLTQPPVTVSTLPHSRVNGRERQQITSGLPVHQSTPQSTASRLTVSGNESNSSICRAASIGDVRTPSTLVNNSTSDSNQRLISPSRNLRVISPVDHRLSSPSDCEKHIPSQNERKLMSPISPREMNGDSASVQHMQRIVQGCESTNDLHKRARLAELDAPRRLENLQKLEELKKHLMNLEKQYEKGKPLVNLVDNMVKLGSLYNRNGVNGSVSGSRHDLLQESMREQRDRLEFNQRVQEQRLLAEERRDWERLSPDHGQLQAKVQQLYKLDRLLQEESGTLHSLQQDKEILEKALSGLRHKLQGSRSNPMETERYRKQQMLLERELSRIRMLLAHNSKKLEETVAENARLEQDLVVLRQKLQASRTYAGNMTRDPSGTTAALETELRRVQQLVGDLQRQRQELSIQVRQLTEKSQSLVQQIKPNDSSTLTGPQLHNPKKRAPSSWLETDLDSGMTFDHGLDSPSSSSSSMSPRNRQAGSPHQHIPSPQDKEPPTHRFSPTQSNRQMQSNHQPIYVQSYPRLGDSMLSHNHISTLSPQLREQIHQHQLKQQLLKDQMQGKASPVQANVAPLYVTTDMRRINCNDGYKRIDPSTNGMPLPPPEYIPPPPPPPSEEAVLMNGVYGQNEDNKFPGLHNREKQEIKTVRIVKRESERRHRDRGDRNGNIGIPLTNGLQAPGGAKRLNEEEFGSQQFEKTQLGRVIEETPMIHAQSTVQLSELDDMQFQRSMSLPRGFGGQKPQPEIHNGPVPPPPRSDSMNALRSIMARRHRVRFENHEGSSDSMLSLYTESPTSSSHVPMSSPNYSTSPSYSPSNQNYISPYSRSISQPNSSQYHVHGNYSQPRTGSVSSGRTESLASPMSPTHTTSMSVPSSQDKLSGSAASINSLGESPQLSPVFKSEAAKQIIKEMTKKKPDNPRRRPVPKEKRRHYTVSSSKPMLDLEDTFSKMGMGRARDDLDMERALRPRINAPDVVRSTLSHKELKYNESTIDQLLGTPNKIVIPERYIPEQTPELSPEEKKQRLKKADAIRKMLSETTVTAPEGDEDNVNVEKSNSLKKKVAEEKRQRDHILQLNQILAKQVMEKSKMVAVKALATLPLNSEMSFEDDDLSPVTPLPLYQQRENFYS
ncbi:uncharacterized protein kmr isoform X7 [Chelonus insularis]|uniref:uncharacterized protein kmr isoform X7 n=1 Tax=Chelonus insularis TaxID=460826 RepID=UPI00158DE778|nr:uncharacterized protein LOC118074661 isoform X7 [Chelonus insularis]